MSDLDAFQSDGLKTADSLKEVAASLTVKGLHGGAAICLRAAALIRELILKKSA